LVATYFWLEARTVNSESKLKWIFQLNFVEFCRIGDKPIKIEDKLLRIEDKPSKIEDKTPIIGDKSNFSLKRACVYKHDRGKNCLKVTYFKVIL
jgi:hypothetical protein